MVKVGILGADSPLAGEVIRILINHPETELHSLHSSTLSGRNLSSHHHGLIGENPLVFSDEFDPEDLDLIIIAGNSELNSTIIDNFQNFEDLKLISISKKYPEALDELKYDIGLSEINRKTLVRTSRISRVPSPAIVTPLIALAPLANFLLLNNDVEINVKLPQHLYKAVDLSGDYKELIEQLKERQNSFSGKIILNISASDTEERGVITTISMKNSLPLEELEKIYDQLYDDHNFTFLSRREVGLEEVEGTQKVVIFPEKPDPDTLNLKIVSDGVMRGGAGDIVHILNLYFGLHEKTGLQIKASKFKSSCQ